MKSGFDFLIVAESFSGPVKEANVSFVGRLGRNRYFNNGPSEGYGAQGILQNRRSPRVGLNQLLLMP